jgi:hypothetical protein
MLDMLGTLSTVHASDGEFDGLNFFHNNFIVFPLPVYP